MTSQANSGRGSMLFLYSVCRLCRCWVRPCVGDTVQRGKARGKARGRARGTARGARPSRAPPVLLALRWGTQNGIEHLAERAFGVANARVASPGTKTRRQALVGSLYIDSFVSVSSLKSLKRDSISVYSLLQSGVFFQFCR